MQTVVA